MAAVARRAGARGARPTGGARRAARCARRAAARGAGAQAREVRLLLVRHAHSEPAGATRDHDRPITTEGARSAASLAGALAGAGWLPPDLILCSDSERTRQTLAAMRVAEPALDGVRTEFLGSFYIVSTLDGETRRHLEDAITAAATDPEADAQLGTVWVMGHNMGWSEAASELAGTEIKLLEASAVGLVQEAGSWEEAMRGSKGRWQIDAQVTGDGGGKAARAGGEEEGDGGFSMPPGAQPAA